MKATVKNGDSPRGICNAFGCQTFAGFWCCRILLQGYRNIWKRNWWSYTEEWSSRYCQIFLFHLFLISFMGKHVIEGSIWRIVVGEDPGGVGGSVKIGDWVFDLVGIFPWLRSFGLTFRLLVLREYSYLGVYLSAVTIWSMPFVLVSCC